jgi:hypothetical protein
MEMMIEQTKTKIKREMNHFMALNVMSIAFGGIALAFAISAITTQAFALRSANTSVFFNSFSTIIIALIVAYLALRYIISTAEVFSKFEEIQDEATEEKNHESEKLTQRIIRLMGLYREEQSQIKRMILVSRIAGVCFFANAIIQTVILCININAGTAQVAPAVGGVLVSLIMGMVGFFLPASFHKYAVCWDERLKKGGEAEKNLHALLEEHS